MLVRKLSSFFYQNYPRFLVQFFPLFLPTGRKSVSERTNPILLFKIRFQIHFLPPFSIITIPTSIFNLISTPIFHTIPTPIFHTIRNPIFDSKPILFYLQP